MSELIQSELELLGHFSQAPEDILLEAQKRMPIEDGRVPYLVYSRKFEVYTPTLELVEPGAVRISFEFPFGFFQEFDRIAPVKTQKTRDAVVRSVNEDTWSVRLATPNPLSPTDVDLFHSGIRRYVVDARKKLEDMEMAEKIKNEHVQEEPRRAVLKVF